MKRKKENKKEKIKFPEIYLNFYFSPHGDNKKSYLDIEEKIKKADVVFLEGAGYKGELENKLNEISNGEKKREKISNWMSAIENAIHNSKKLILFTDLDKNHKDFKEVDNLHEQNINSFIKSIQLYYSGEFEEAIKKFKKTISSSNKEDNKRERIIREKIKENIEKVRKDERFAGKEKIKIFSFLGLFHQDLADDLKSEFKKEDNIKISSHFPNLKILPLSEIISRKLNRKEKISDELYAKALFEKHLFLQSSINKISPLKSESMEFSILLAKRFAEKLNLEDIKKLSGFIKEKNEEGIQEIFKKRNLIFSSEEEAKKEMEKFMKKFINEK